MLLGVFLVSGRGLCEGAANQGLPMFGQKHKTFLLFLQKRASKSEFYLNRQWVFKLVEPNKDTGK